MIKGVIFDMDGVLVDNRDAHIEAFTRLFKKYGVPFDREKFMPSFGMTNDMIFAGRRPNCSNGIRSNSFHSKKRRCTAAFSKSRSRRRADWSISSKASKSMESKSR